MVAVAVNIRLNDLLDLPARQQRGRRAMVRARDQHLAGADRISLREPTLPALLAVRFEANRGIKIWHDPDPPTFAVGGTAGGAIGEHLGRRQRLVPGTEGAAVRGRARSVACLGA